jgi:hypothetical protein
MLNATFVFITQLNGKPNTVEEYQEKNDDGFWETKFTVRSKPDLLATYANFSIQFYGDKDSTTPIEIWSRAETMRTCARVDFDPTPGAQETNSRVFNLFRKLAITREEAIRNDEDAGIITGHVRDIWAKGDSKIADYLLNWMAHLIQKPHIKMMTVPVLKGGQGAGKGLIIQLLGKILGDNHFLQAATVESVTGGFQEEAIKTNLLCFLDECTFSGDKKQASQLKGIITVAKRRWEAKFINAMRVKNFSNLIIASNYDAIVHVESDDRRYVCVEVDSRHAGPQTPASKAYFDRLAAVKPVHFAHMLYHRDITGFNPKAIPSTSYARDQKVRNFDLTLGWICTSLEQGYLKDDCRNNVNFNTNGTDVKEPVVITCGDLFSSYRAHARSSTAKWKHAEDVQKLVIKQLKDCLQDSIQQTKKGARGMQSPAIKFSNLEALRCAFQASVKEATWDWSEMDTTRTDENMPLA